MKRDEYEGWREVMLRITVNSWVGRGMEGVTHVCEQGVEGGASCAVLIAIAQHNPLMIRLTRSKG